MKKTILKKYAELIVQIGANVQRGQDVIINAETDQSLLVEYIVSECYKRKANIVTIKWQCNNVDKITSRKASIGALSKVPNWVIEREKYYVETLPALIYIESADPDGMKGINQEKIAKVGMKVYPILKPFHDQRDNKQQWTIVGAASPEWAKKVFPELRKKEATEKLWESILFTSRALNNPIKEWQEHNDFIKNQCQKLNKLALVSLHYSSKNGTDLTVGLLSNADFIGGVETTLSGISFNPNIPTEECFTSPKKGAAEGIVYSTKPLSYRGELIENFWIKFKEGKAVEVHAEKNENLLKQIISMDPDASYLGECALVPHNSPISESGILFWNTLYDENASCHLALGMGFTNTIRNYSKYSLEELKKMGINDSMVHVDFMIGSKDLSIIGHTSDGRDVQIFKNGNWSI
ncbi:MAG: aminopeptidase [Bacilli bacterium]|jgi:aminopeptidase